MATGTSYSNLTGGSYSQNVLSDCRIVSMSRCRQCYKSQLHTSSLDIHSHMLETASSALRRGTLVRPQIRPQFQPDTTDEPPPTNFAV